MSLCKKLVGIILIINVCYCRYFRVNSYLLGVFVI